MAQAAAVIAEARAPHAVLPDDVLVFPLAKSTVVQPAADGGVTLFHGTSEIDFTADEAAFAMALAERSRFTAADAARWSRLDGDEVAAMLSALVEAGVLRHAADHDAALVVDRVDRASPLPPAPAGAPRTWRDPTLVEALTGTALDPAWLETIVPIFRVAHAFRDTDGRQVGEANVFPPALRLEVATQWRTCTYSGTRYQAERPMNVTALKAMRVHWRAMMAMLAGVREAYLRRFPEARQGWTVAHVERLSTAVLALPSLLLLRRDDAVVDGDLHPVLSNLFRVTDGLRMVMHQMLFVPVAEPMRAPDEPVTTADILTYAERNFSFFSPHAVCAGPQFMMDDFLSVLLDGAESKSRWPAALELALEEALAEVEAALDYALLGLQTYAAIFGVWPAMARAYAAIADALDDLPADPASGAIALRERFAGHRARMGEQSYLASEEWRRHRETVFDDMHATCGLGLTGMRPATLSSAWAERALVPDELTGAVLAVVDDATIAGRVAAALWTFLDRARAALAASGESQRAIGVLLGRPAPSRALTLDDLDLHNRLLGEGARSLPFLPDELGDVFALAVRVDADGISIRPRPPGAAGTPFDRHPADRTTARRGRAINGE